MESTEDDIRTAKLATEVLADQGRADLSVSPEQLMRWRQVADAIPVQGSRRGGRGQRVHYLPTAPAAAAALAVALDTDRNLDRAVLAAFGRGAPITDEGVRAAAKRYLREIENKARQAYGAHSSIRSDIPRRLRVPLTGSRRAGSSLESEAMLALLLGEQPRFKQDAPGLALDALVPEASATLRSKNSRWIEFVVRRLTLAALRMAAQLIDVDRWRESCTWVTTVLDYGEALRVAVALTGSEMSAVPGPFAPLVLVVGLVDRQNDTKGRAPGFGTSVLGLVGAALTTTRRRAISARETAQACATETPKLRAIADLARDLPEGLRPALAFGSGPLYLAQLPAAEREAAISHTRQWMSDHPAATQMLLPGGVPPIEGDPAA